ncbi:LamG-like jellyroll fold domain-containing protein [Polaribacter tangerinus]|uniref:LamG-like jellyroll fold domain-containing protein n=1 Tax=Polaribacter tangerinus TaxID=1920034 RepID=UPI000B4BE85F|nr:LamG-like jellyroll fold domain-containing protein [Polaribacter tangerinus]
MKTKISIIISFCVLFFLACTNDNIDPITAVSPNADETAPVVKIIFPADGFKLKVNEKVVPIDIKFEVTDDIEVGNIAVKVNNTQIGTFSNFKDYRKVIDEITFDNVTTGVHVVEVVATDLDGKTTTSSVTFEKEPPYVPLFPNEVAFWAFDGDYTELISVTPTPQIGTPGFAGEAVVGTNAYAGAENSYLSFPTSNLSLGSEFSASFWYKVNATPDRAGLLVVGPVDEGKADDSQNNRKNGFRLFRENAGGKQRIKLNVGNGTRDTWVDGGAAADIDPNSNDWVHISFTISATEANVYINGNLAKQSTLTGGVDWTGCDILSIMSGEPRFNGWNHKYDGSYMDDLRIFNKALTRAEVQNIIGVTNPYKPADGETLYMPFNDNYSNIVTGALATEVGTPTFAGEAKKGSNAYAGAVGSYLTMPTDGLQGESFTATMWHKLNATPDRAGVLVMGPVDDGKAADKQNNRKFGFRFFRENAGGNQRFKLNVGNGTADTWVDGGTAADVDPTANEWVHLAFTISPTKAIVYINGEIVKESDITGVDFTGCDILSIMSGSPRFNGWNHNEDLSFLDELHLFNKALTQQEIKDIM